MSFEMRIGSLVKLVTSYLNASLAFISSAAPGVVDVATPFNWTSISPSSDLIYHECYTGLECARLEVPLDWSNLSNPNKVALAVARIPAVVDVTDPSFGGTIILNPGGPSGSGISLIHESGPSLQKIVDDDKHYELLSFDPRGVHYSTPGTACFDDVLSREVFNLRKHAIGMIDISEEAFNSKWAAIEAFGKLCAREEVSGYADGSNIRNYVSSTLVARDMVAIVDNIDGHLRSTTQNTLADRSVQDEDSQKVLNDNSTAGPPLINYWGFSYGTILGNFLATLHPERVGRMILDGVADVEDYLAAPGWTTSLQDNDFVVESFYRYCFDGGATCPLFKTEDKSPLSIKARVNEFLKTLMANPMPAFHNGTAALITYDDVRQMMFSSTYAPVEKFPGVAQNISELMSGNTTAMFKRLPKISLPVDGPEPESEAITEPDELNIYDEPVPPPKEMYAHQSEALSAILCGDSHPLTSISKSEYRKYTSTLQAQSQLFGGIWAELAKFSCVHWPASLRPKDVNQFAGPFTSSRSQYDSRGSPILFIGNTADNVTPVRNAHKMAKSHEGSVVLTQDSIGHCSVFSSTSTCTREAIRKFFATGKLPNEGTVCKGERVPWDGKGSKSEAAHTLI